MKRYFCLWLSLLSLNLAGMGLYAQSESNLYGAGSDTTAPLEQSEPEKLRPCLSYVVGNAIAPARFDESEIDHAKISFANIQLTGGCVVYYQQCYDEGVTVSMSYWRDQLHWKRKNFYFDQQNFDTVSLGAGLFSSRLGKWNWKSQLAINVDVDHNDDFCRYTFFDLLLWGRYSYSDCIGVHVGFVAETGQRIDHVYPILGVDWTINPTWKLNAVFPTEMSLVYNWKPRWSFALAARVFEVRHRMGKHELVKRGLIEYRNTGVELGANYTLGKQFSANVHVGSALGGHLKISNHHHHRLARLKFRGSPYLGGEVNLHF